MYPIVLKSSDRIIGIIGHYNGKYLDKRLDGKNLMRVMIDTEYRRKGYAFEILKLYLSKYPKKYFIHLYINYLYLKNKITLNFTANEALKIWPMQEL